MQLRTQAVGPVQFSVALQPRVRRFDEKLRDLRARFSQTLCGVKGKTCCRIGVASGEFPSVETRQMSDSRNRPLRAVRLGGVMRGGIRGSDSRANVKRQLSPDSEVGRP